MQLSLVMSGVDLPQAFRFIYQICHRSYHFDLFILYMTTSARQLWLL
jgi:hypothetical protein